MMKLQSFSVIIFDRIPDFSDIKDMKLRKSVVFEYCKKEHILLKTALACCKNTKDYDFETNFYPVYIIVKKYLDVLDLFFCHIKYIK